MKVNIDKHPQIANGLKVSSIPAVFLIYGGKVVDNFVGIPDRERMQDFFNKAVIMDQITNDPNVQQSLVDKSEELLKANDLETAMGVLADLYQYDAIREKFEPQILAGIAYCLTMKYQDYPRSAEMIKLLNPERKKSLSPFFQELVDKAS